MNVASVDNRKPWTVNSDERPAALEVSLLKRVVVLPWTQFLYAEGGDDEVRLVFASHDVIVRGAGLGPLLADVGAQRVTAINEPTRPDRFPSVATRFIREIVMQKAGEE